MAPKRKAMKVHNTRSGGRRVPGPTLLSTVPELLPQGTHPLRRAICELLADQRVSHVDVVSYRASLSAIKDLRILEPRDQTRLVLVSPEGMSRPDVQELAKLCVDDPVPGLEIRQLDPDDVQRRLIHYKLIIFHRTDLDQDFAVIGSANLSASGIGLHEYPNAELSVLVKLEDPSIQEDVFAMLWNSATAPLRPDDFAQCDLTMRDARREPPSLLAFQRAAYNSLLEAHQKHCAGTGDGGGILALPTGAGKTLIAVKFLLDNVLDKEGKSVLWIAPHRELLVQAQSTFEWCRPYFRRRQLAIPSSEEVIFGKELPGERYAVRLMTNKKAATLASQRKGFDEEFALVVVDEAHWGAASGRKMIPALAERFPRAFFLGLTGTPFRKEVLEMAGLHDLFGPVVNRGSMDLKQERDGRKLPVLAKPENEPVDTFGDDGFKVKLSIRTDNLSAVVDKGLSVDQLKQFDKPARNAIIAKNWKRELGTTLVFAVSTGHADGLAHAFKDQHPGARVQVLHTKPVDRRLKDRIEVFPEQERTFSQSERSRVQDMFGKGEIDVLIAMNLYTMGVDFPKVETLFMSRPTLSPVLYAQMLGRGMRGPAFGGTDKCKVFDFIDQEKALGELKNVLMNYDRLEHWSEDIGKQLDWARETEKRLKPEKLLMQTKDRLRQVSGFYRIVKKEPDGQWSPVAYVQGRWRFVEDIGKAVKRFDSRHFVQQLPMKAPRGVPSAQKIEWCRDALRLRAMLLAARKED